MTLTITELALPERLERPEADEFFAWADLINACWNRLQGNDVATEDPALMWTTRREQSYSTRIDLVAKRDDVLVGTGHLMFDNSKHRTAEIEVCVRDDADWTSIGGPLHDALIERARAAGRTSLQGWSGHLPVAREGALVPPTGYGWVSRNAQVEFLTGHGYSLEQVERHSGFDLTGDLTEIAAMADAAQAFAGPNYRTVWWTGYTPAQYALSYGQAIARMSTDVPAGELVTEASTWTPERVAARDANIIDAGGVMGRTAVIHEPTGDIVAFNELQIGADRTAPTCQWGTLVLPEHRGKRLGTIVKAVGLAKWREAVPTSALVHTWNAEENRYMLSVNERVGFRPLDYVGAWQLTLP